MISRKHIPKMCVTVPEKLRVLEKNTMQRNACTSCKGLFVLPHFPGLEDS